MLKSVVIALYALYATNTYNMEMPPQKTVKSSYYQTESQTLKQAYDKLANLFKNEKDKLKEEIARIRITTRKILHEQNEQETDEGMTQLEMLQGQTSRLTLKKNLFTQISTNLRNYKPEQYLDIVTMIFAITKEYERSYAVGVNSADFESCFDLIQSAINGYQATIMMARQYGRR